MNVTKKIVKVLIIAILEIKINDIIKLKSVAIENASFILTNSYFSVLRW